jgi:hypothetical protein
MSLAEMALVTQWATVQLSLGRTFPTPQAMLRYYTEETKTSMVVDSEEEMAEAVANLLRRMRYELGYTEPKPRVIPADLLPRG